MGDPVTIGLMVAGTAMQAMGQIQAGKAAKAAGDYNAAVANRNAQIARSQAEADAAKQEREGRLRMGANLAARAGSGVTLEGSALDVLEDNAAQEELDRLTILHGGEVRGSAFEAEAGLERMRGKQALKASRIAAAGTVLMGGAKAYGGMQGGGGHPELVNK